MNRVFLSLRAKDGERTRLEEDVQEGQRHAESAPSAALWRSTLDTFLVAKKVVGCPLLTPAERLVALCMRRT